MTSNRAMERAKSVPKTKPASAMARAAGFGKPGYGKGDGNFGKTRAAAGGGGVFGGTRSSGASRGG